MQSQEQWMVEFFAPCARPRLNCLLRSPPGGTAPLRCRSPASPPAPPARQGAATARSSLPNTKRRAATPPQGGPRTQPVVCSRSFMPRDLSMSCAPDPPPQAAKELLGVAKLGAVDCDKEKELCGKYGIKGFPTLKWFGEDKSKPKDYNGAREAPGMVQFAQQARRRPPPWGSVAAPSRRPHASATAHVVSPSAPALRQRRRPQVPPAAPPSPRLARAAARSLRGASAAPLASPACSPDHAPPSCALLRRASPTSGCTPSSTRTRPSRP